MGYFRSPQTYNEKKQWGGLEYWRLDYTIGSRAARRDRRLLDSWDDLVRSDQCYRAHASWKLQKHKRQWMHRL